MEGNQPGSSPDETERWIEEARRGDQQAWERLHDRYRPLLAFTAEAGIPDHMRGRFDADDVLQSVFLSAFRSLHSYRHQREASFRAWLKEITRNELASRIRTHEARKRSAALERPIADPNLLGPQDGVGDTPSQIVTRSQRRTQVLSAIGRLDDAHQEVLWMRDFERCTWDAIARQLGCTPSSARRRHKAALDALVTLLR